MARFFLGGFRWHAVKRGDAFAFCAGDIRVEGPHPFCSSGGNLGNRAFGALPLFIGLVEMTLPPGVWSIGCGRSAGLLPRARLKWSAPMTRIIIVVLALVAAVSACQYPGCVEADRLASQCGGGGHCAELQQAQKRACADVSGQGPQDASN
jgi:hypothetical protein